MIIMKKFKFIIFSFLLMFIGFYVNAESLVNTNPNEQFMMERLASSSSIKRVTVDTATLNEADKVIKDKIGTHYFKIVTRINIEIPIFDNIFGSRFLYINGDTMIF